MLQAVCQQEGLLHTIAIVNTTCPSYRHPARCRPDRAQQHMSVCHVLQAGLKGTVQLTAADD